MKINEIFHSLQGEGIYIGRPMAFVRVTGCNLRCAWCDTKYAYDDGKEMTVEDILNELKKFPTNDVCLTGGEPLHQENIISLVKALTNSGYIIYLETNGSKELTVLQGIDNIRISMDIKCPSSGEHEKMHFDNLGCLNHGDQLKFIIADKADYEYAKNIIENKLPGQENKFDVIFTPCEVTGENSSKNITLAKLAEMVLRDGLNVRVLPQLHKIIWPEKKSGV